MIGPPPAEPPADRRGRQPSPRAEERLQRGHEVTGGQPPCRYSSGSTSATLGLLRHHGGSSTERNRFRWPVTGSTRRSLTRGAWTATAPAAVRISRWRAWAFRPPRPPPRP